ncbi:MAG: hypothetical protein MZU95_04640 [Desulfomicrobium escambiense]|nr:hypothetical protein [Desulfomicrobium escambiense]
MRVGQPGVQRREAHLGAVADEQEDEGRLAATRGSSCAGAAQEVGRSSGATARRRPTAADRRGRSCPSSASAMPTEQMSRYFQVGLERAVVPVEVDERRAGERRRLDRRPRAGRGAGASATSVIVREEEQQAADEARLGRVGEQAALEVRLRGGSRRR